MASGTGSTSESECICPSSKVPDDNGDCVCDAGFAYNPDGTCQRCAPGSRKSERGNGPCERCFAGASCGGDGSAYALEALPLDDGWWRLSPSSTVAYRCPLNGTCPGAAEQLGACLAWNAEAFYKLAWAAVTELPVQCALCKKWRLLPASVDAEMASPKRYAADA